MGITKQLNARGKGGDDPASSALTELDRAFIWKAICIPAIVILPFLVLVICAHPVADDFSLGAAWRDSGLITYLTDMYRNWSGRLFGLSLAPLPIMIHYLVGSELLPTYQILCACTLIAIVGASLWASLILLPSAPPRMALLAGAMLAAALVAGAKNPEQLVYWFTGISFYTIPGIAILLITVWLWSKVWDQTPISMAQAAVTSLAGLLVALSSEFSGIALILLIASSLVQRRLMPKAPRQYATHVFIVGLISFGTLIVLLAPGNAVRLNVLGVHEPMIPRAIYMIPLTARDVVEFLCRRLINPAVIATVAIFALFASRMIRPLPLPRSILFGLLPLGAALIAITTGLWMGRIASGEMLEERAQNQLHFILVASLVAAVVAGVRAGVGYRYLNAAPPLFRIKNSHFAVTVLLVLALFTPNFWTATKFAVLYCRESSRSVALQFKLMGAGPARGAPVLESDLVLPRLSNSNAFFRESISEDPNHWVNQVVARYMGIRSVRIGGHDD